jgi:hypothetical protein
MLRKGRPVVASNGVQKKAKGSNSVTGITVNVQLYNFNHDKTFNLTKSGINRIFMDVTSGKQMLHTKLCSTLICFTTPHMQHQMSLHIYMDLSKRTKYHA